MSTRHQTIIYRDEDITSTQASWWQETEDTRPHHSVLGILERLKGAKHEQAYFKCTFTIILNKKRNEKCGYYTSLPRELLTRGNYVEMIIKSQIMHCMNVSTRLLLELLGGWQWIAVGLGNSPVWVFMSAALPIFATTPLGHCCKQEYALSQVGWLNKDEREETKIRGQLNFFFLFLWTCLLFCQFQSRYCWPDGFPSFIKLLFSLELIRVIHSCHEHLVLTKCTYFFQQKLVCVLFSPQIHGTIVATIFLW